jgi:hypothetical protein
MFIHTGAGGECTILGKTYSSHNLLFRYKYTKKYPIIQTKRGFLHPLFYQVSNIGNSSSATSKPNFLSKQVST